MRTNGCLEAAFKRGFRLLAVKMFPPGQLLQAPLESKWSWTALQRAAFSALIQVKSRQLAPMYPSEATLSPLVTSQWNRNPCLASEGQCRQQVMAWLQFYVIAMPEDGPWISVLFYHGFYHGEPSSVFKRARPIFILSDHSITQAVLTGVVGWKNIWCSTSSDLTNCWCFSHCLVLWMQLTLPFTTLKTSVVIIQKRHHLKLVHLQPLCSLL